MGKVVTVKTKKEAGKELGFRSSVKLFFSHFWNTKVGASLRKFLCWALTEGESKNEKS